LSKTITITIAPNGQSTVETSGFAGAECKQASRFIEQSLGQRTSEKLTSEFYASETQQQHEKLR